MKTGFPIQEIINSFNYNLSLSDTNITRFFFPVSGHEEIITELGALKQPVNTWAAFMTLAHISETRILNLHSRDVQM